MLEQLIEEACDLYDWIALLWAAYWRGSQQGIARNVNYRRALILFQTPKTCFGQEWRKLDASIVPVK